MTTQVSTLLYVEDDRLSREVMELIISTMPHIERLFMFEDSTQLLQRIHALPRKPDLILLDIHMQPMDGFSMLRQLRDDPAYTQATVIAVTASVMNEEIQRLQASGFDGAISKPLSIQTFPGLISEIAAGNQIWYIG